MKRKLCTVGIFIGFVALLAGASIIDSGDMALSNGVFISLLGLSTMWANVKALEMVE